MDCNAVKKLCGGYMSYSITMILKSRMTGRVYQNWGKKVHTDASGKIS